MNIGSSSGSVSMNNGSCSGSDLNLSNWPDKSSTSYAMPDLETNIDLQGKYLVIERDILKIKSHSFAIFIV